MTSSVLQQDTSYNTWREKGNTSFRQKDYNSASDHYTQAITQALSSKISNDDLAVLYSNRSASRLHLKQYYESIEDAKEAIRRRPMWAKGYFRKGEVEYETFHLDEALLSYRTALILQPEDVVLKEALSRVQQRAAAEKRYDQMPWLGAAIGIILAACLVLADQLLTQKPALDHPISMAALTFSLSLIAFSSFKCFRIYVKNRRALLLNPPVVEIENNEESNQEVRRERPRYSKVEAKRRFKRGKS